MLSNVLSGFLCHLAEQAAEAAWEWLARPRDAAEEPEPAEPWWTQMGRPA